MRIERLPQENARTQGAAHRLWYRQRNPERLRAVAELLDATLALRSADAPGAAWCSEPAPARRSHSNASPARAAT